jgi:hypothetical protein
MNKRAQEIASGLPSDLDALPRHRDDAAVFILHDRSGAAALSVFRAEERLEILLIC